jgi:hypothetical protein
MIIKTANASKPFGGLQIIACGDFFQLPPVSGRDEPQAKLCFEAKVCLSVYAAHAPHTLPHAPCGVCVCVCVYLCTLRMHLIRWRMHHAPRIAPTASCARSSETVRVCNGASICIRCVCTSYWCICVHMLL